MSEPVQNVVTRFAPSPTGQLHVGNIRTALHNWLLAKQAGGKFLLRIDDTDAARSREAFVDAIRADLAWLGLHPMARSGSRRGSRFMRLLSTSWWPPVDFIVAMKRHRNWT